MNEGNCKLFDGTDNKHWLNTCTVACTLELIFLALSLLTLSSFWRDLMLHSGAQGLSRARSAGFRLIGCNGRSITRKNICQKLCPRLLYWYSTTPKRWGLLNQFNPLGYFPHVFKLLKTLAMCSIPRSYLTDIDTRQILVLLKNLTVNFMKLHINLTEWLTNGSLVTPSLE